MATDLQQLWSGIDRTTLPKYLTKVADHTIRNRMLLAWIKSKGRITFNHAGTHVEWRLRVRERQLRTRGDGGDLEFDRHQGFEILKVDWREYAMTDRMTERERLMNKGPQAIINRYSQIGEEMSMDMANHFAGQLFKDGDEAGAENRVHGFESFCGFNAGNVNDDDLVIEPEDTYGGHSTKLGALGGFWSNRKDSNAQANTNLSNDWPEGQGDPEYDWLAPKLINYGGDWGTGGRTWEDNAVRAMRFGIAACTRLSGKDGKPQIALLAPDLDVGFKNAYEPIKRIEIPHKTASDLGFEDALNFDGVATKEDYDVPAGVGYLINPNEMELCCLTDKLFVSKGPMEEPNGDLLWRIGFFGNLKWNPKAFGKMADFRQS